MLMQIFNTLKYWLYYYDYAVKIMSIGRKKTIQLH